MLKQVPFLCFFIFGITYPLFLWLSFREPIRHHFHRFQMAYPLIVAGLALCGGWLLPLPVNLKIHGILWLLSSFCVTGFYWNKEEAGLFPISLISFWGVFLYALFLKTMVGLSIQVLLGCLISGFCVSSIFYAMDLGHFYLNVLGLKVDHLKTATKSVFILTAVRLCWDIYHALTATILHAGEPIRLARYLFSTDGLLLWVAFFFGVVFPLGGLYFAFGTLKLKNTQATTGILYVVLSGVLLGDLAFKYYLIKYGLAL